MKYTAILCIVHIFVTVVSAQNETKYQLNDIVVSTGRTPISIINSAKDVTIINAEELALLPVNTLQDVLQFINGVDLKQRGVEGVQADISIRGGTFEQSLIMIDGIKIVDPQTGHHNLNLTLAAADIERIEVVKGQASKTFGTNAFSGVINIITKKSAENIISVEALGGENNYFNTSLSANYNLSGIYNRISVNRSRSDGYRNNTEFEKVSFNYSSNYNMTNGTINLLFGFNEKDFGANSFYSIRFPEQAEHTITKMLNLSANLGSDKFYVTPKIYWRRNDDEFVLNKFNPDFYKNLHQTNVTGVEIQATYNSSLGSSSIGVEYANDEITSNNLGKHNRQRKGLFFEHAAQLTGDLNVNLGGFVYKYAANEWQFWPGLDVSYNFNGEFKSFISIGKAFRIPTYTELYYSDPVTLGNSDLSQEEVTSHELGTKYTNKLFASSITIFRKEGKNIIDWVRTGEDNPWSVRNVAQVTTNGFEAEMQISTKQIFAALPITRIGLNFTYLDSDKKTDQLDSRYALDYLRYQLIANINHELPFEISAFWFFRYEDRVNFEDTFLVETQLRKEISEFTVSLKVTNLFNKTHHDIAGVTLPGRWITGGVKYSLVF